MKNIIITAGGTIENIDEVRKLTNTSTGKLGSIICNEIVRYKDIDEDLQIHYILSTNAEIPLVVPDKIKYYKVTDTDSVIKIVDYLFQKYKIDCFIHSMAVSDFTASYSIQVEQLVNELVNEIRNTTDRDFRKKVTSILQMPMNTIDKNHKISSKNDIIINLKRTPKIISTIKKYDKEVFLVGFKLLSHVSKEQLISAAAKLEEENQCNIVVANDIRDISEKNHIAHLIKGGISRNIFNTKEEIAKGLIAEIFRR
ncbi:hypothetical protein GC105_08200 [Alkalibaculum sp. M08DMB]|uniref:DNA/pantothenate metabolism flavoprotein C-terminal domain-containing protein n=1 Tax=Alkalibaculum sporogenes TaxID=2655001 RepID=A0A6A7K8K2_9FIRM|nr:phosphopantothenoylcysteine decarboxylase [Alkalibaculum sporogenes]MPW25770.1 hypothetical protein [Alkalibaculum sporogenes]